MKWNKKKTREQPENGLTRESPHSLFSVSLLLYTSVQTLSVIVLFVLYLRKKKLSLQTVNIGKYILSLTMKRSGQVLLQNLIFFFFK